MTLVGYFNSLRELGGMRRMVDDDVRTRLGKMAEWGLAKRILYSPDSVKELTSRLGSAAIPETLDRLENVFDPAMEEKRKEAGRTHKHPTDLKPRPLDVLLATNMISVGVDVPRLGLMVCSGQPKTTSEYIQATSRVGRKFPGLVVTVYNWARPRDLSHFETFEHYHATFYQHVEALSVTPFSEGAIYRGLSALLVSLDPAAGLRVQQERDGDADGDRLDPPVRAGGDRLDRAAGEARGQQRGRPEGRGGTPAEGGPLAEAGPAALRGQSARLRGQEGQRDDRPAAQAGHRGVGRVHLPELAPGGRADLVPDPGRPQPGRRGRLRERGRRTTGRRPMSKGREKPRVGELRPSQMLTTFGVGSVVDLPHISVMVMGLEDWPNTDYRELTEERLLASIRNILGAQVNALRSPPIVPDTDRSNPFEEQSYVGVPVAPFPRWMLCPRCRRLAPLSSNQFILKPDPYRPDRVRVRPRELPLSRQAAHRRPRPLRRGLQERPPRRLPVGQLRPRRSPPDHPYKLQLLEMGPSGEAADIYVRCETCDTSRPMSDAFKLHDSDLPGLPGDGAPT